LPGIGAGVNYFGTAVRYGNGESEKNLGRILAKAQTARCSDWHEGPNIERGLSSHSEAVAKSHQDSLARLRLDGSTSSTCTEARAGLSTLNEGQTVEYEEVANRGKTSAENLKVAR
jgi:hypothetical protein